MEAVFSTAKIWSRRRRWSVTASTPGMPLIASPMTADWFGSLRLTQ